VAERAGSDQLLKSRALCMSHYCPIARPSLPNNKLKRSRISGHKRIESLACVALIA
jgi:hypothetical protein